VGPYPIALERLEDGGTGRFVHRFDNANRLRLEVDGAGRACLARRTGAAEDKRVDLGRIVANYKIMGGVPCVAGTRIPVTTVVGLVANGLTTDEIVTEYPQLVPDDVQACLGYAARAVDDRELPVRLTA
jgi:uncharacterized protein (DUF433 family)